MSHRPFDPAVFSSLVLPCLVLLCGNGCGATSGTSGTGGTASSGGAPGSGGQTGTGGVPGSGGQPGSGGAPGTGGVPGSGGQSGLPGSGGQTRTGGAPASGGNASGGQPATGGQTASGGQGGQSGQNGGGRGGTGVSDGGIQADAGTGDAGSGGGTGGGAGVQEMIHYYGRWNVLGDRAITVNAGSHLAAQFSGTAIVARFDVSLNITPAMPTLAWQIDQGTWQEAEVAARVSLGTGLGSGPHSVTVMARALDENQSRWSPPLVSSITFLGFDVTGGVLQASPRPVRPKMEILGDSITEGVVIWKSYNGKTSQCWRNDARVAYPSQTAQMLGAEWRQVGFGYLGILKTGNGGVPKANDSFNWIYKDVPRDGWHADMVVVNEGTNDSGAAAATFRAGYATYLTTIRAAYPNAKIMAMRPFSGAQAAPIKAEVEARNAAGDARVFYVDTTGWLEAADLDGLHPNAQGSMKAAQALVAAIKKVGLP